MNIRNVDLKRFEQANDLNKQCDPKSIPLNPTSRDDIGHLDNTDMYVGWDDPLLGYWRAGVLRFGWWGWWVSVLRWILPNEHNMLLGVTCLVSGMYMCLPPACRSSSSLFWLVGCWQIPCQQSAGAGRGKIRWRWMWRCFMNQISAGSPPQFA